MDRPNAWKGYTEQDLEELERFADGYIDFISQCKTERACCDRAVEMAKEAGYISLEQARDQGRTLVAGDRIYAVNRGKNVILVQLG